jgi:hypothetical protein
MIQVIERQNNNWHMVIHGKVCTFAIKPMALYMGNNLFAEDTDAENGLRWRINRKWISYKQVKAAISKGIFIKKLYTNFDNEG